MYVTVRRRRGRYHKLYICDQSQQIKFEVEFDHASFDVNQLNFNAGHLVYGSAPLSMQHKSVEYRVHHSRALSTVVCLLII